MTRLGVAGVGRIGGEVAYLAATLLKVDELVLYDQSKDLLNAQVLDLEHTGLKISISTDKNDLNNTDICVFAAGMPRDPSVKSRADLLATNLPVTKECAALLRDFSGILITVTNPMDVNNFLFHRLTGIPRERCIGFGGQLDSARFGIALNKRGITGFPFVLGEHGEHQVPVFSYTLAKDRYPDAGRNFTRTPELEHGGDQGQRRHGFWSGTPHSPPDPDDPFRFTGNWWPAPPSLMENTGYTVVRWACPCVWAGTVFTRSRNGLLMTGNRGKWPKQASSLQI